MIFIAIVIGCILGAVIGIYAPIVPYTYSGYLAIAILQHWILYLEGSHQH